MIRALLITLVSSSVFVGLFSLEFASKAARSVRLVALIACAVAFFVALCSTL